MKITLDVIILVGHMQYNSLDSYSMAHGMMGRYVLTRNDSCKIKPSRASEQRDQAIKDEFHRPRFLIPVAKAYVTTPC